MKSDVRGPSSHIATRKARPNGALALAIESLGFEAPRRPKPSIDIVGSPVETILTDGTFQRIFLKLVSDVILGDVYR